MVDMETQKMVSKIIFHLLFLYLQDEKAAILDEVMDKETYKVATKILERFDPARLQGSGGAARLPVGPVRQQPPGPAGSPLRGGLVQDPKGMELRRRAVAGGPAAAAAQQLNSSLSLPATAALNTSQVGQSLTEKKTEP
jgi:hypothetical protein